MNRRPCIELEIGVLSLFVFAGLCSAKPCGAFRVAIRSVSYLLNPIVSLPAVSRDRECNLQPRKQHGWRSHPWREVRILRPEMSWSSR